MTRQVPHYLPAPLFTGGMGRGQKFSADAHTFSKVGGTSFAPRFGSHLAGGITQAYNFTTVQEPLPTDAAEEINAESSSSATEESDAPVQPVRKPRKSNRDVENLQQEIYNLKLTVQNLVSRSDTPAHVSAPKNRWNSKWDAREDLRTVEKPNTTTLPENMTDIYAFVEESNQVANIRFIDKSLEKKYEKLQKTGLEVWEDTKNSAINFLYSSYHTQVTNLKFDNYTTVYFIDSFFLADIKQTIVTAIRESCREAVEAARFLTSAQNGGRALSAEEKTKYESRVLSEYFVKNVIYCKVAEIVQADFRDIEAPRWERSKGEPIDIFYSKILAIEKMAVGTVENPANDTEKRNALV